MIQRNKDHNLFQLLLILLLLPLVLSFIYCIFRFIKALFIVLFLKCFFKKISFLTFWIKREREKKANKEEERYFCYEYFIDFIDNGDDDKQKKNKNHLLINVER